MRYGVTVDYETEGWVDTEVDAPTEEEARKKAQEKVEAEILSTSVLDPRHTPCRVKMHISSIEPA